jgi:hypothetical protein
MKNVNTHKASLSTLFAASALLLSMGTSALSHAGTTEPVAAPKASAPANSTAPQTNNAEKKTVKPAAPAVASSTPTAAPTAANASAPTKPAASEKHSAETQSKTSKTVSLNSPKHTQEAKTPHHVTAVSASAKGGVSIH